MFKTTGDLRTAMVKLYQDVEQGKVTASVARAKVQVAKTIVDTLKVEIAAANLGKQFGTVRFDEIETSDIKRVA